MESVLIRTHGLTKRYGSVSVVKGLDLEVKSGEIFGFLPPPLSSPPPEQSFLQDFMLLRRNQLRVSWNKLRHRPVRALVGMVGFLIGMIAIVVSLGIFAYGSLKALYAHQQRK